MLVVRRDFPKPCSHWPGRDEGHEGDRKKAESSFWVFGETTVTPGGRSLVSGVPRILRVLRAFVANCR